MTTSKNKEGLVSSYGRDYKICKDSVDNPFAEYFSVTSNDKLVSEIKIRDDKIWSTFFNRTFDNHNQYLKCLTQLLSCHDWCLLRSSEVLCCHLVRYEVLSNDIYIGSVDIRDNKELTWSATAAGSSVGRNFSNFAEALQFLIQVSSGIRIQIPEDCINDC